MHNPTTRLGLPVVPDDQAAAIATESGRPSDDILLSTSQSIWVLDRPHEAVFTLSHPGEFT